MSNELSLNCTLTFTKGGQQIMVNASASVDIAGNYGAHFVQTIGTSQESVTLPPEGATFGYVLAINRDSTNYVQLAIPSNQYTVQINPGEFALFRPPTTDYIFAKASVAQCKVEFVIIPN